MDLMDIYNDLDEFHEQEKKKSNELLELETKCNEALRTIEAMNLEKKDLRKKIRIMQQNFQSLLDTAKAEIKRKDKLIEQLRKEKDDICFRRQKAQISKVENVFAIATDASSSNADGAQTLASQDAENTFAAGLVNPFKKEPTLEADVHLSKNLDFAKYTIPKINKSKSGSRENLKTNHFEYQKGLNFDECNTDDRSKILKQHLVHRKYNRERSRGHTSHETKYNDDCLYEEHDKKHHNNNVNQGSQQLRPHKRSQSRYERNKDDTEYVLKCEHYQRSSRHDSRYNGKHGSKGDLIKQSSISSDDEYERFNTKRRKIESNSFNDYEKRNFRHNSTGIKYKDRQRSPSDACEKYRSSYYREKSKDESNFKKFGDRSVKKWDTIKSKRDSKSRERTREKSREKCKKSYDSSDSLHDESKNQKRRQSSDIRNDHQRDLKSKGKAKQDQRLKSFVNKFENDFVNISSEEEGECISDEATNKRIFEKFKDKTEKNSFRKKEVPINTQYTNSSTQHAPINLTEADTCCFTKSKIYKENQRNENSDSDQTTSSLNASKYLALFGGSPSRYKQTSGDCEVSLNAEEILERCGNSVTTFSDAYTDLSELSIKDSSKTLNEIDNTDLGSIKSTHSEAIRTQKRSFLTFGSKIEKNPGLDDTKHSKLLNYSLTKAVNLPKDMNDKDRVSSNANAHGVDLKVVKSMQKSLNESSNEDELKKLTGSGNTKNFMLENKNSATLENRIILNDIGKDDSALNSNPTAMELTKGYKINNVTALDEQNQLKCSLKKNNKTDEEVETFGEVDLAISYDKQLTVLNKPDLATCNKKELRMTITTVGCDKPNLGIQNVVKSTVFAESTPPNQLNLGVIDSISALDKKSKVVKADFALNDKIVVEEQPRTATCKVTTPNKKISSLEKLDGAMNMTNTSRIDKTIKGKKEESALICKVIALNKSKIPNDGWRCDKNCDISVLEPLDHLNLPNNSDVAMKTDDVLKRSKLEPAISGECIVSTDKECHSTNLSVESIVTDIMPIRNKEFYKINSSKSCVISVVGNTKPILKNDKIDHINDANNKIESNAERCVTVLNHSKSAPTANVTDSNKTQTKLNNELTGDGDILDKTETAMDVDINILNNVKTTNFPATAVLKQKGFLKSYNLKISDKMNKSTPTEIVHKSRFKIAEPVLKGNVTPSDKTELAVICTNPNFKDSKSLPTFEIKVLNTIKETEPKDIIVSKNNNCTIIKNIGASNKVIKCFEVSKNLAAEIINKKTVQKVINELKTENLKKTSKTRGNKKKNSQEAEILNNELDDHVKPLNNTIQNVHDETKTLLDESLTTALNIGKNIKPHLESGNKPNSKSNYISYLDITISSSDNDSLSDCIPLAQLQRKEKIEIIENIRLPTLFKTAQSIESVTKPDTEGNKKAKSPFKAFSKSTTAMASSKIDLITPYFKTKNIINLNVENCDSGIVDETSLPKEMLVAPNNSPDEIENYNNVEDEEENALSLSTSPTYENAYACTTTHLTKPNAKQNYAIKTKKKSLKSRNFPKQDFKAASSSSKKVSARIKIKQIESRAQKIQVDQKGNALPTPLENKNVKAPKLNTSDDVKAMLTYASTSPMLLNEMFLKSPVENDGKFDDIEKDMQAIFHSPLKKNVAEIESLVNVSHLGLSLNKIDSSSHNSSFETKRLSIGSSQYLVECDAENVATIFITRKKRRKHVDK